MFGEAGNDVVVASDNTADGTLDGGEGFDIADVDATRDLLLQSFDIIS
jgi:hypothetical protein